MLAIQQAQRILAWQENLSSDEIPPEWMWPFEEELESWFEDVEQKRKEKFGGGGTDNDTVSPMWQNELTRGRRG